MFTEYKSSAVVICIFSQKGGKKNLSFLPKELISRENR
jgi:hypothetical protein